ncbi:MAG: aminotransferase class I/II-fold pyridoxal phosphate-dependent enzyme [Anaerolineae bacterium]|nr:aminotransferase class I/II-fold pyridoxal phosphate-dependent enzyme [Anaerolineae bacterium]
MPENYFATRMEGLKPSAIRKFFDIAATMQDVISLGIGEPDFDTPAPIVQAGVQSLLAGQTHYTSNVGILQLRQALAAHLQRLYGVAYAADEIVITVGGSEALYLAATAFVNPGDEVIIPTPCFVSYQAQVHLAGGIPVEVACKMENNFEVDPRDVEAAITPRTKAILLGFPSNPTGAVARRETLMEIARLAEQHDLLVFSDEIYDRLVYGGSHVCFPALPNMAKRTILLGGFSKDYAMTGWRIGYAAAPAELLKGMLRIHQYTVMCASTTAQVAATEALLHGDEHVRQMVAEYDRRRKLIVAGLNQIGLPTFEPRGAFYAFPKVSDTGLTDEEFASRLLVEEKVAAIPGNGFGAGGEGHLRCSYATAYEKIEEALRRIERFVNRL